MSTFQFIPLEPEQLNAQISETVQKQLEVFFKDFQPKQPDEYLTREQAANLLKVNISTINNWKRSGKLRAYGIGNRVYFLRSDIEKSMVPLI